MDRDLIEKLLAKGVKIPAPDQVFIEETVQENRIASGVLLHPGARIYGAKTFLAEGTLIGEEGPVVLKDVLTGRNVRLKGGFFQDAVFLEGASAGSGSHVRGGTILEEGASIAHSVGLKQTILFPWVSLGSLINFCDIFMSGGTGPKNHSEVGSSYIHFNFTPDQDKATPSLLGDVPAGVMLDQAPIFLGGQGGLVGPCRLAFGTVIAAGTLQRKDEKRGNRLIFGDTLTHGNMERKTGNYPGLKRILENNFLYLANLHALKSWYFHFRRNLISESFPEALWEALLDQVQISIKERIARLSQLREKLIQNPGFTSMEETGIHRKWVKKADEILVFFSKEPAESILSAMEPLKENFFSGLSFKNSAIETIQSFSETQRKAGSHWLGSIVDFYSETALDILKGTS